MMTFSVLTVKEFMEYTCENFVTLGMHENQQQWTRIGKKYFIIRYYLMTRSYICDRSHSFERNAKYA